LAISTRSSGRVIVATSMACFSPSTPVFTNLTIQATRSPPIRDQTRNYRFDARPPNLQAVPLHQDELLDITVIHGGGTTTAAKKGGDNIGFSGHKKVKGDKVVAFCDRHCNVITPFVSAPGNRNESPLLREALPEVMRITRDVGMDLEGGIVSLDGVYDWRANRKAIFNRGMIPNINPNGRGRTHPKRGRKPLFDPAIFEERFQTIERVFAWEDKFRRLLLRFDRLSQLHYAFKTLAYTMINLRHYCQS
jgi:Transposase DDE domain